MPRTERSQKFLIDPLAVTRDPTRRAMSAAARGAYDNLWLESWCEKEPGVLPDDDVILAGLAQLPMHEWLKVRAEVATGFACEDMRGHWICLAVTRTKSAQDKARTRWRNSKRSQRMGGEDKTVMSSVGSGTGSGAVQKE